MEPDSSSYDSNDSAAVYVKQKFPSGTFPHPFLKPFCLELMYEVFWLAYGLGRLREVAGVELESAPRIERSDRIGIVITLVRILHTTHALYT